ncbi:Uncharacterised protein [Mycobacteroides abscessus]|jgi:hypothetical protein|nr:MULTISPECIES: hypothetical protein [Mycobacteriaceae]CPT80979.1 Uncharacterised protein [Mycobacteroides abscessus]CPU63038.1 Uncharacterised protein [Mycobacteroides abscessus]SKK67178.1 Uncharacterised protein [Mycobacteroides abscessus subsp. massiliense]SKV95286.1 Uncharacterised protein [Mycobacteroides abscessus subsp. massiliense]SKW97265.1 Uncharacterised protein [Mycobacteroides abscessus subsp. massiliense]
MKASYQAWTIGQALMAKGRFASLPDGQRKNRVSADGLSVTIWDENGTKHMPLDFAAEAGSEKLRKQWVSCIASANGPAGSWRSIESARGGSSRSRVFLKWASDQGIGSLDSLTADDWSNFVSWVRDAYPDTTPQSRNSRLAAVRVLLAQYGALSYEFGQALAQRYSEINENVHPDHYTASELQQIRSAATRALRTAWRRIEPNWALAQRPKESVPAEQRARWEALQALLRAPHKSLRKEDGHALGVLDQHRNVQMEEARCLLFLATNEGLAAYGAIVAATGENSSTTSRRRTPSTAASAGSESITIFTSERDKRRRSGGKSLMAENAAVTSPLGKLLQLVMDCTAPARHSAHLNPEALLDSHAGAHQSVKDSSSESLILFMRRNGALVNSVSHVPKSLDWMPSGLHLDLRRLHRTYLTRVAQHPVDNRYLTWIDAYILKDPKRIQELEDIHRAAQQKALDAVRGLAVRLLTEEEAAKEGLNTAPTAKGTR